MKRLVVLVCGVIFVGSLGSCMKDDDVSYPQAVLTMVNGYISSPAVMYAQDNNAIQNAYSPLTYKSYDFTYVFPGSRRIRVFNHANAQIADDTYTFKDSTYYTSFVFGKGEDAHQIIVEDQLESDLGDDAALRFYHLSPSEGKVNVYLGDTDNPFATNVTYAGTPAVSEQSNVGFEPRESGSQTIIVTNEDDEVLLTRDVDFEAGAHYSIILIGDSETSATPLYIGVVVQYRETT